MFKDGAPGNLSYHSAANDSELISFTSGLAGQTYTGVSQCFDYYAGQTDKVMITQEFPSDYPLNYPNIVMPGLVLYLDAGITQSYPGSGTTWTDLSLSGNNGTLINGPTYISDNGGYLVFDGASDYVVKSNFSGLGSNPSYTMMTWMQFGNLSIGGGIDTNIMWYGGETIRGAAALDQKANKFCSLHYGDDIVFNSFSPVLNTSYHALMSYDNSSRVVKLYVNGVFIESGTHSGNLNITSQNLFIGGGPRTWTGKISTPQIYNRVLSDAEVLQNYNSQKGRFGL
jgi:hypothetical protein